MGNKFLDDLDDDQLSIKEIVDKVIYLDQENIQNYTGISLSGSSNSNQNYDNDSFYRLVRSVVDIENTSYIKNNKKHIKSIFENIFKIKTNELITMYYNLNTDSKTQFNEEMKQVMYKGFELNNEQNHIDLLNTYEKNSNDLHYIHKDMKDNHKNLKDNTKEKEHYEETFHTITRVYYSVLVCVILIALSLSVVELSQGLLLGIIFIIIILLLITYRTSVSIEGFNDDQVKTKDNNNEKHFQKYMTNYIKQSIVNILTLFPEGIYYNLKQSLQNENKKYKKLEIDQHKDINNVKSYNSKVLSDTLDYSDTTYLLLYFAIILLIIKILGVQEDRYRYLYIILIVLGILIYLYRYSKRTRIDPKKKYFPL